MKSCRGVTGTARHAKSPWLFSFMHLRRIRIVIVSAKLFRADEAAVDPDVVSKALDLIIQRLPTFVQSGTPQVRSCEALEYTHKGWKACQQSVLSLFPCSIIHDLHFIVIRRLGGARACCLCPGAHEACSKEHRERYVSCLNLCR